MDEYGERVFDESNKEIKRKKAKCKYCEFEAFHEFKRCPQCGREQDIN